MKIEAEVESPYAFHHHPAPEEERGVRGAGEAPPSAQERPSIGRPEWQPAGCGGCGPASSEGDRHSLFDCEHFQFIDDDECDEGVICDDEPQAEAPAAAAPRADDSEAPLSDPKQPARDVDDMGESESSAARSKSHAVKRQASLDESTPRQPRSVLKKPASARVQKNRVKFDEAVTMYSDESDEVQLLQLTTGPDIIYSDCYYMFEPPIEYRDLPPFDPPAEYRDSDETSTPTNEPEEEPPTACVPPVASKAEAADVGKPGKSELTAADPPSDYQAKEANAPQNSASDVAVSAETDSIDSAAAEKQAPKATPEPCDPALESDKVFERFLEAEREFAVDEELNNVFRALENDFVNDDRHGGALDDNFFRKLITLLSSAEGDPSAASSEGGGDLESDSRCGKSPAETEDDDSSLTPSRTLSEADSDCSISSQDTIIVRLGEDDADQISGESVTLQPNLKPVNCACPLERRPPERPEGYDEVFSESASSSDERPRPLPRESVPVKSNHVSQVVARIEKTGEESLSRQSSGEQSVNSATSQDHPQDADDSTSSDSRSGEVEEDIRLDDLGYDEEDAEDYDEESFRGMARGSSKIRRIIKKNALQCTLFRGIEAKRRQQPGAKYPRPKSPLLSQESLVEKLKWLTTMDDHKEAADGPAKFHSKPPDVILSTGGVPVNGSIPHSASSETELQSAQGYHPAYYQALPRHMLPPNSQGGYYLRRDGFPPTQHPSLPRQRAYAGHPSQMHTLPHPQNRVSARQPTPQQQQQQWAEQQRPSSSMTVPRSFRDWRVIQRLIGGRSSSSNANSEGGSGRNPPVPVDYVRSPNGSISAYPVVPPDVSRTGVNRDELEQFVEKDSRRMELIRRRYSVAEQEEEDPTFGFARRPSVKGVQKQIHSKPSEGGPADPPYVVYEDMVAQGPPYPRPAYDPRAYGREPPGWRSEVLQPVYQPATQVPMHVHRASVALTELPGSATLPYAHRKPPHQDVRYHSYAESMYGSTRTLPTQGWLPPDPRTACLMPAPVAHPMPPPMLQVPPHSKDERGVPEGASSSPKITSDSMYHNPVPDSIASGGPHKDDGMIYYSLNV